MPWGEQLCSEFIFPTVVPGKVVFNQAMTTLTSITISWTEPSNDHTIIMKYHVQFTNSEALTTDTTTKLMYVLEDFPPSTKIDFSVSAVSTCGVVGESSSTTEYTNAIRK